MLFPMFVLVLSLACSRDALDDSGGELAQLDPVLEEASALPCPAVLVSPAALSWSSPAAPSDVTVTACGAIEVSCPDWLAVVAGDEVALVHHVAIGPIPGRVGPAEAVCIVAGVELPVQLDVE